jgi:hypothetical protein
MLLHEDGTYEINRTSGRKKLPDNPYIQIDFSKSNLRKLYGELVKLKPTVVLLSFRMRASDLNLESGSEIAKFLLKLTEQGINFKLARSLPRCIFDFDSIRLLKSLGVSTICKDCLELIGLRQQFAYACRFLRENLDIKWSDIIYLRRDFDSVYREDTKYNMPKKCEKCIFRSRTQCGCYRCVAH